MNRKQDLLLGATVGAGASALAFSVFNSNKDTSQPGNNKDVAPEENKFSVNDSGFYRGITSESDGMIQQVAVDLEFTKDGMILGSGKDDEDGEYQITNGQWKADRATWKEEYDDFYVRVWSRKCLQDDGITVLDCRFVSSFDDITGTFELAKVSLDTT